MRRQHDLSRSRLPRPTSAAADPLSSTTSRPSPLLSCPTSAVTSPPPSAAAASRASSPPLPSTNSRSPPLLPPPPPASTSRSPPLISSPPPAAASTTHPAPLLSPPPSTAASTTRPRQLFTDIDGVSQRLADVAVEGRSYSWLEPPPCEDTEQAVRIEAPPPPRPFPPVSSLMPTKLLIKYFLRVDADGLFHTYPHRGGPFKSLKEAQDAIDSYHTNLCKFKYMGDLSEEDIHVWQTLYWPNGTRMNSKQALDVMMNRRPKWDVLNALLDKYNEDHHLFGGKNSPYKCRSFSHLNLIVKSGSSAVGDLFFAEITCMKDGELEEHVLSCICVVTPEANGECCGCGDDVKHPTGVEYKKRDKLPVRRNGCRRMSEELFNEFIVVCDEDCLDAEEARVRREFRMSKRGDGQGMRGRYVIPAKR